MKNLEIRNLLGNLNLILEEVITKDKYDLFPQMISILDKIEKLLRFNNDEQITIYLKQLLEQNKKAEIIKEFCGSITDLMELCDNFACKNKIDENFLELYKNIFDMGLETLESWMIDNFKNYYTNETDNAKNLLKSYNRVLYWGRLDYEKENYELIHNRAAVLINYAEEIIWMYFNLSDYTSKEIMTKVLCNWVTFSHSYLRKMPRNRYSQYFDYDLIDGDGGEIFVDAGACMGDTVDSFVSHFKKYRIIYSYEITPDTFQKLKNNVRKYKNVVCKCQGLSDKKGMMYLTLCEDIGGNRLGDTGETEVPVTTLDDDIKESIDFIKMDIEGAEYGALEGARRHIVEEHPKLAIAAYHNNLDIFRLARLIYSMEPRYRFYFRYYGGTLYPNDYVLYAVVRD